MGFRATLTSEIVRGAPCWPTNGLTGGAVERETAPSSGDHGAMVAARREGEGWEGELTARRHPSRESNIGDAGEDGMNPCCVWSGDIQLFM